MANEKRGRSVLWTTVKIAISGFLLAAVLSQIALGDVAARLRQLIPIMALAAVCVLSAQLWLAAFRWREVGRLFGVRLSAGRLWRHCLVAQCLSQLLPTSIGGDAVRTWLLKCDAIPLHRAIPMTVADRLVGVAVLFALVGVVIAMAPVRDIAAPARFALSILAMLGVAAIAALVVIHNLLHRFLQHSFVLRITDELIGAMRELSNGTATLRLIFISIAIHACSICGVWLLARGLGLSIDAQVLAVITVIALFAMTIPISVGGWGVREGVFVTLLGPHGIAPESALALSVSLGAMLAIVSLPGGFIWLTGDRSTRSMLDEVKDVYQSP